MNQHYVGSITEFDARPTGVQLKRAAVINRDWVKPINMQTALELS